MQGLDEQKQHLISEVPVSQEVPASSANLVKQAIAEPKENLWYLRIMHGVKAGVAIGGPAGTLAAPVLGTAIGTLGGGLLGGISFFILGLPGVRAFLEKHFPNLYADIDADLEKIEQDKEEKRTVVKQSFFRLSRSNFAKWDMRFLMGVMAGAGAGAAIGTIFPGIGTAIGAVVGGLLGGIAAVAHNQIVKKIAPETELVKANAVEQDPSWYAETKHDIPWYIRLVCGETAGLALGAAIGAFVGTIVFPGIGTVVGTAMGGAIGALAGGGLAWVSPMFFAGVRKIGNFISRQITKIKGYFQLKNEIDIENSNRINIEMVELNKRDDKNWPEVLKEDAYDLPWYVRAFAGASGGALVGAAIGTVFPGVGTVIGGFAGAIAGTALSIASPALFAFFRSVVTAIKNNIFPSSKSASEYSSEKDNVPGQKNQTQPEVFDVPWYFRGFFGASVGAAIGAAIGTVIFPGIGTAAGTAFGTLIGAGVFIALPTITAVYSTVTTKVSNWIFGAEKANNNDVASKIPPELTHSGRIPWTVRAMGASLVGGLIGGAIGSIFPGVGTVLGTGAGALLATAIYVGVPALFDLVDRKLFSGKKKEESFLDKNYLVEDGGVKPGVDYSMIQTPGISGSITLGHGKLIIQTGDDEQKRKVIAAEEAAKKAAEEAAAKNAAAEAAAQRALADRQVQAALPSSEKERGGEGTSSHSADQLDGWDKTRITINPGNLSTTLHGTKAGADDGKGMQVNGSLNAAGAQTTAEHQEPSP